MTNRNEGHEQYLAMTKKVAEEILGEMRKEISGNQHDQMDSIVQDVSTRIVEGVNKIDEELEQRINDAKKRFQGLPQKFLDASIKVDSNAFQQRRNTFIDIEISNISTASKIYNIPVDIVKVKESILQLVRKK